MKKVLSLALSWALICPHLAVLGAQTQGAQTQTGAVTGKVLDVRGVIEGRVTSEIGRGFRVTMQLVNPDGTPAATRDTDRQGNFSFPDIAYGMYTLQCMDDGKVIGTSPVTLSGPSESVKMVCTTDAVAWWKKKGLLAGLGAAATAIGATAIVATKGDASGAK